MSRLEPLRVVGHSYPRVDAVAKVTGSAMYCADFRVPGMLHAAIVRSLLPHARLTRIDKEPALAVPGVLRVLVAEDLRGVVRSNRFGPVVKDAPLLAEDVVRYEGEPVALVIGRDAQAVRKGVAAVHVEYAELPIVADVVSALAPQAPRLHREAKPGQFGAQWAGGWEPERNIAGQYHDRRGDPDEALHTADHVFTHEYSLPPLQHYALENHVVLVTPESGGLTVRTANQYPFLMVEMLADLFGLPESAIRVQVPYVGGAFGSKEYVNVLPLAAVAARVSQRPVLLEVDVEEAFRTTTRHGAVLRYTSGISGSGLITVRKIEILFDTGAYADQGPRVVRQAGYRSPGPYRIPNLQVDAYAVYTNKVPAGAYRGFGASQPIFACECHMDEIAHELNIDPIEFRLNNLLTLGEDYAHGDLPLDCDLPEALHAAMEKIGESTRGQLGDGRVYGVGFAVGVKNTASGRLPSSAIVRIHSDGSATVAASSVELGQGAHTMLAQLAAETLGCSLDRIRVAAPDTALTPFDQRTSSSRATIQTGAAVVRAASNARDQLLAVAARLLGVAEDTLRLEQGTVRGADRELSCAEIIAGPGSQFGGEVIGVGYFQPQDTEAPTAFGMKAAYWEGSVGAARVAVDIATGEVEVLDYVTVADVGRLVNPLTAHGQEEGGVVMGLGHALFEACEFESGHLLNPSPVDYRVPLATDGPRYITSLALERADGPGPFGTKGLGESSIITVAPAITNAVASATGHRFRSLPLSPWRIWEACRSPEPQDQEMR